jgi:hypothetical protein
MKRTAYLQELAEEQKKASEQQRERMEAAANEKAHRDRRLEKRISLIGLVGGAPVLIISFLGINLVGLTTHDEGLSLGKALLIILGLSAFLITAVSLGIKISSRSDSKSE